MKILRIATFGLTAIVAVGVAGLYATGNGAILTLGWALMLGGPSLPFDPQDAVSPPDYSDPANWAALPNRSG